MQAMKLANRMPPREYIPTPPRPSPLLPILDCMFCFNTPYCDPDQMVLRVPRLDHPDLCDPFFFAIALPFSSFYPPFFCHWLAYCLVAALPVIDHLGANAGYTIFPGLSTPGLIDERYHGVLDWHPKYWWSDGDHC